MTQQILFRAFEAGDNFPRQSRVVALNDSGKAVIGDASNRLVGVSAANIAVSSQGIVDVQLVGVARIGLAGSVDAGDLLMSNAAGKAVVLSGAGRRWFGTALESGASGEEIAVLLSPGSN